jgi:hypothetical protein
MQLTWVRVCCTNGKWLKQMAACVSPARPAGTHARQRDSDTAGPQAKSHNSTLQYISVCYCPFFQRLCLVLGSLVLFEVVALGSVSKANKN